jgi:hypothetical protein
MHLLRLFLTTWFSLAIVTASLLFWLCKRAAATVEDSDKWFSPQRAPDRDGQPHRLSLLTYSVQSSSPFALTVTTRFTAVRILLFLLSQEDAAVC